MSSDGYLLDANALIALVLREHEHHSRVSSWASSASRLALCPIVEGALLRALLRLGESQETATGLLRLLYEDARFEFWADSISYTEAELDHVIGHRQVTDAYLVALARSRGAELATLDRGLADALPAGVLLIP